MAGINHNKTDTFIKEEPVSLEQVLMIQNASNGGYLGGMALRPLTDHWTVMSFVGGALGSDSYSSVWAGAGASYKINDYQSFSLFGFFSEDDYGSISKLVVNYTYEFK